VRSLLLVGLILLAGCGASSGTVTAKDFAPAHDEQYIQQIYMGETCTGGYGSVPRTCSPNYMWMPATRHVADHWSLKLEQCSDANPDADCEHGTVTVTEAVFNAIEVGDFYAPEEGS
jgi:hypothetical protein